MPAPQKKQPTAAEAAVLAAPHKPTPGQGSKSYAGDKVTVCSKLPFALEIQRCEKRPQRMTHRGEAWIEEVAYKVGPIAVIAGNNYPVGAPPEGTVWPDRPQMANGFAMTFGVDRDLWESWLEDNKENPFVKNGLIFAQPSVDDAKAQARDNRDRDSGLGPLKPDTDRRMPKKFRPNPMGRPAADAELTAAE
jgi:hypothetical protein